MQRRNNRWARPNGRALAWLWQEAITGPRTPPSDAGPVRRRARASFGSPRLAGASMVTMDQAALDLAAPESRRAYRLGIANGILFALGAAFVDPATVLPTFVSQLTDSDIAVGLISAIGNGGWFLPQLFVASYLHPRPHKRPLYVFAALLRGFGWVLTIPVVYFLAKRYPLPALVGFFLGYSISSFGGGLSGPAFLDIVAKTVPSRRLGRFFGHRQFWGGLAAIAAGILVRSILGAQALPFPVGYCLLFCLALVSFAPGWALFAMVREPPGDVGRAEPFLVFMRNAPRVVREHREFRLLLLNRVLVGAAAIALPFYIVYCRRVLGVPESAVGTYLSIEMAGSVVAIPLWAHLNDHRGPRTLLVAVSALAVVVPAAALGASMLPLPAGLARVAFGLVFFGLAAAGSGGFIGATNHLLSIAPERTRTLYIGIQNTLFAVTTFLPLLGGLLVQLTSYQALFGLAGALAAAGTLVLVRTSPAEPSQAAAGLYDKANI